MSGCKLCGEALAYTGAVFCGAKCCAQWESGKRLAKASEFRAVAAEERARVEAETVEAIAVWMGSRGHEAVFGSWTIDEAIASLRSGAWRKPK